MLAGAEGILRWRRRNLQRSRDQGVAHPACSQLWRWCLLFALKQGRCAAQDDNSWTPNGTAIAILGRFFKSGELVCESWSKELRAWVRAPPAEVMARYVLLLNVLKETKSMRTPSSICCGMCVSLLKHQNMALVSAQHLYQQSAPPCKI